MIVYIGKIQDEFQELKGIDLIWVDIWVVGFFDPPLSISITGYPLMIFLYMTYLCRCISFTCINYTVFFL